MNESNTLKQDADFLAQTLRPAVAQIAPALRIHATAARWRLGTDSYLPAELARVLLRSRGICAQTVAGFAAWRVGPNPNDMIGHAPDPDTPLGAREFPYYAWLRCDRCLVDLATYQLPWKVAALDAVDGRRTTMSWCPAYLILHERDVQEHRVVIEARTPGLAYYERRPELESKLQARCKLDPDDIAALHMLLAEPGMRVISPNHLH